MAVDVGGTTIKGLVVSEDGQVLHRNTIGTPVASGPDDVVRAVRGFVQELVQEAGAAEGPGEGPTDRATGGATEVAAVGVVVPGSVDGSAGVARFSANIGWVDVPLRSMVADDTGLPTVLDHDVRAAGIAEAEIGLTGALDDSLLAVIGTGVAGVLRAGGQTVHGATGVAGEIGHLPVWPEGEACPCGQRGCLERYASGASISRRYREATGQVASADDVLRRAATDPAAARVWDEAVEALAIAFASCVMMFDPALIVISGGLSEAGARLLDPVQAGLAERVRWRPPPPVLLSGLGDRSGVIGAAILAARAAGIEDLTSWSDNLGARGL